MHRYLAQFRDRGQQHFKNGCGFDRFDDARRYVALVMEALGWIAEGRVIDTVSGECVHHSPQSAAATDHIRGQREDG